MAKKKLSHSHQEKPVQKQEDFVKPHQEVAAPMDSEASEKLENLKSLNQMLLKEAFERRQQVESLVLSKESLEMELKRSNSEREALRSELTLLSERAARLKLEQGVVDVFVAAQVAVKGEVFEEKTKGLEMEMKELRDVIYEKESEIGSLSGKLSEIEATLGDEREVSRRVCVERDETKGKLDLQIEEGKRLRENLLEFEEKKRAVEREIGELRVTYNAVVGEKEEREMRIESITREKDSVERSLAESNKLSENIKKELDRVVREKEGIEEEKNVEMSKRQELENAISGLNDMVVNLQNEEVKLQAYVAELEKKCVEGEERQRDMRREIDQLVVEKKLCEKRNEELADERTAIEKDFNKAVGQLAEQKHKIEEMVNENIVILEAKGRLDSEVCELQTQVAELKTVVLKLEENSRVEVEKIKKLESEVWDYICKLEEVKTQRDEVQKFLHEEKQKAVRLNEKIGELENIVGESLKASEEVRATNAAVFAEKVELESQCEKLKKEIVSLENTITEARNEFDSMKGKVEIADANTKQVLNMLKDTAAFCSKDEGDSLVEDVLGSNGEETKAYVTELEMIKSAFKSKVTKVENMKKQLELLHNSVQDAQKKKSFWTVLSSATTLLAAISIAYIARGH